ncbi:DUF4350 domain-containing protein [Flavobacterium sp. J372]|uniref:DUF4350 domain-containing protein n=1 Tax=Flavobacterium sp. J372 TaxID=2898436 RepID=UPI002151B178|nr:DUF4350 domain-containing protein [Flavobacterium sp. J372]MCR5861810.1 DUF4350 domain-containing protein [Flavobacterium sp. J372]
MNRTLVICGALIVCIVGLMFYADSQQPKPVDWRPTYGTEHKNPLGLYVFRQEMASLFEGDSIHELNVTPYEYLEPKYDYKKSEYRAKGTFIHINEGAMLDGESAQELLYFAQHGNTIFISAKYFPDVLLDSLGVEMPQAFNIKDSVVVKTNTSEEFILNEGSGISYFKNADSTGSILGYQRIGQKQELQPNFIAVTYGNGRFLLHTQPAAFSNYYLLKDNYNAYAASVLSYIPEGDIYLFSSGHEKRISGSSLRYIMGQPALKSAFWIALLGLLVFMFFNAKRRQRIVPVISPLRNTTIDFTKTIGNLYYNSGDHHNTIDRMLVYFFERVRNELKIDTTVLDEAFIDKLAQKTDKPREDAVKLVSAIKKHRVRTQSTEADVIDISKAIENIML